ncbi:hypothetical protein MAPG_05962 [Magnaporthiopsis poae ATCC 64411]|uniref:Uncharacterized protein n=1 Tax=Magnaporthiopsis poae (strain ATCC 64411 / 73-15) TaxID=644358 RepID=A0A0C4E0S8_MAGP6|nr:hypothetical protein MAPG_05962 [Magnaporthiopsis poae ATCC 64411]
MPCSVPGEVPRGQRFTSLCLIVAPEICPRQEPGALKEGPSFPDSAAGAQQGRGLYWEISCAETCPVRIPRCTVVSGGFSNGSRFEESLSMAKRAKALLRLFRGFFVYSWATSTSRGKAQAFSSLSLGNTCTARQH